MSDTLPVWDEQFSAYAAKVVVERRQYIQMLSPLAKEAHAFLTDGAEELSLGMDGNFEGGEEEVREKILRQVVSSRERDIRLGFTTVGPHRDDIKIMISGADARGFCSQGQARTAALSMKLSEALIFERITGEKPVLILDDVMSELDLPRRRKLLERVKDTQCILTCTHAERVLYGAECNRIRIQEGKII